MNVRILAVAVGAGLALGAPSLPPAPSAAATPAPGQSHEELNPLARDLIAPRMQRHGGDLQELALSVTLLRHERTRELALEIAGEPRMVKLPGAGANELESTIPDSFFALQDLTRAQALTLAEQARRGDDLGVGRAFSALHQTCVSCHASYLPRTPQPPAGPGF